MFQWEVMRFFYKIKTQLPEDEIAWRTIVEDIKIVVDGYLFQYKSSYMVDDQSISLQFPKMNRVEYVLDHGFIMPLCNPETEPFCFRFNAEFETQAP